MLINLTKISSLMLLVCFSGCAHLNSQVYVELYGQKLPIKMAEVSPKVDNVFWAFGDNAEAFRSALCAPNPGAQEHWCLYVNTNDNVAVLAERARNSTISVIYHVNDLKWEKTKRGIEGQGAAECFRYDQSNGQLQKSNEGFYFAEKNLIRFTLDIPPKINKPPVGSEGLILLVRKITCPSQKSPDPPEKPSATGKFR